MQMEQIPIKRNWETDLSGTRMYESRAGWEQSPVRGAMGFAERDEGPHQGR